MNSDIPPGYLTAHQVRQRLRAACAEAGSQHAWGRAHNVHQTHVSEVLSGIREPAGKILAGLAIERVVLYRPRARNNQ
jgi:hypothetical protein